ncbi:MAG TPA: hypothetical protein DEA97_21465 [Bacteroidales bacterium]|nr:MAG: Signal transduction histidine kinase, LytS [candidate division TM6 bacterium GW2011_GWF2_33_332]HBS89130.1 hypothetical protein [Bacteroidales bacterium]
MSNHISIKLFILLILFRGFIEAQTYQQTQFTVNDGLPQNNITSIFQDSRGFLWIGTYAGGVSKFDGKSFSNYSKKNGLPANEITCIAEDKNQNIWIGTSHGIVIFNGKSFTKYSLNDSLLSPYIADIYFDSKNNVWISTPVSLHCIIGNKIKTFTKNTGLFNDNARQVIEFSKDNYFVALAGGISNINQGKITNFTSKQGLFNAFTDKMCISNDNKLWIGMSKGLCCLEKDSILKYIISDNYRENYIISMAINSKKEIIIGTLTGLHLFKNGNFEEIKTNSNTSFGTVNIVFIDNEQIIWVGTPENGLYKLQIQPFTFLKNDFFIGNKVSCIQNDNNGNIWIGSEKGIAMFYDSIKVIVESPIFKNNKVNSIVVKNDSVWFSSNSYYGYFFKNKFKTVMFDQAYSLFKDKDDKLWFGAPGILYRLSGLKRKGYNSKDGLTGFNPFEMIEDKNGDLWIATESGPNIFKNDTFIHVNSKMGLKFDYSYALAKDKNKDIWIGSYGNGLIKYDGKSFFYLPISEKTSDNLVFDLYFDNNNSVWAMTDNGLFKGNEKQGKMIFKKIAGLNSEFKKFSIAQNCLALDNINRLWFIENSQVVIYDKNKIVEDGFNPNILFKGLYLFYDQTDFKEYSDSINPWNLMPYKLELPFDKNHLTFEFIGINSSNSEIEYKWMLEGFENKWFSSKNNRVTYSNLPSGNYCFKVQAFNSSGKTSEIIEYRFTILTPYWQALWFKGLLGFFILCLISLLFFYRVNSIKKREAKKTIALKKIAELELKALQSQMNPHFIFNSLNSVQSLVLDNKTEEALNYLNKFAKIVRVSLDNSSKQNIPLHEEIEFLRFYIDLEKLRFQNKFDSEIIIENEISEDLFHIPPMIIQPFVENAIKHGLLKKTDQGHLLLHFKLSEKFIHCIIEDNGIGRLKSLENKKTNGETHVSKGIGITKERIELINSKSLSKEHLNIELEIIDLYDSEKSPVGTRIIIKFPIK